MFKLIDDQVQFLFEEEMGVRSNEACNCDPSYHVYDAPAFKFYEIHLAANHEHQNFICCPTCHYLIQSDAQYKKFICSSCAVSYVFSGKFIHVWKDNV